MLRLFEHAGFEPAHDEHHWWIYDARVTSPRTCQVCIALDGTHYRGDEIDLAFPFHLHMRVNAIKALVHPNCRCVLRWTGRTKDVLTQPYGLLDRGPKRAKIDVKTLKKMKRSDLQGWWRVARFARETFKGKKRLNEVARHARETYRFRR